MMVTDRNGVVYEFTDVMPNGDIVHHHGCKKLTPLQKERFDKIISKCWDSLPMEKQLEINRKIEEQEEKAVIEGAL